MEKMILICLGYSMSVMLQSQTTDVVKLQVNTEKQVATIKKEFNGTIMKDGFPKVMLNV
jgi:hypothetical protein